MSANLRRRIRLALLRMPLLAHLSFVCPWHLALTR